MNTLFASALDARRAVALSFLGLVTLVAFSSPVDARACGLMRPPPYMAAPPRPMALPMRKMMPGEVRYGAAPSVIAVAQRFGDFDTLLAIVDAAGLKALVEGKGPFTLFAPTDAAFAELPPGALDELMQDKAKLTALLKYHLVAGGVSAADILQRRSLETVAGQALPTADLSVVRADVPAGNGVIHVVDKVLLPAR